MVARTQSEIADKLAAIPGVTSVGFAAAVPMDGNDPNWDTIAVEGKHTQAETPPIQTLQLRFAGILPDLGHAIWSQGATLPGTTWACAADGHGLREFCARFVGIGSSGDREAGKEVQ